MAGSILIGQGVGVTLNGLAFVSVVEEIRRGLTPERMEQLYEVYRPYDEGGMPFLSLWDEGAETFNVFRRAAEVARDRHAAGGFDVSAWDELIGKLNADPRCS